MELKRVVVTGLGAITPIGNDADTTWKNALAGVSGAGPITHFDASQFKTQFACEVKGFNGEEYFDRKKSRALDLYAQYAFAASVQAIKDSGLLEADNLNKDRVGVIIAAGIGGLHTFEEEAGNYSGHVSMEYGFHGPNFGTVSACASSNNAIIDAFNLIRLGKADAIVTGGAEAAVFPAGVGGFNAMHALSTRNDSPETASRPFSKSRDGFVIGEGGVVLILEELEHALARGAKIYAEVAGGGLSADAYHITATHPEGLGAKLAMKNALEDAGMTPADIDYINAHGTSTPVGDISEVKAIVDVFGENAHKLNISSTKSMTGHLLGATGALEAMFSVKAVQEDIVPPTINHDPEDLDENIDYTLNFTFDKPQKRTVRAALSNSFGFGGHNATVIVKKFEK